MNQEQKYLLLLNVVKRIASDKDHYLCICKDATELAEKAMEYIKPTQQEIELSYETWEKWESGKMLSFISQGEFQIAGRGLVHVVELGANEVVKIGDQVKINEIEFEVLGIEKHCLPDWVWQKRIGLLVKEIKRYE